MNTEFKVSHFLLQPFDLQMVSVFNYDTGIYQLLVFHILPVFFSDFPNTRNSLFSPARLPKKPLSDDILEKIEFLTPNRHELELVSGMKIKNENDIESVGKALIEKGVKNVIITLGSKGCLYINNKETTIIPAFKVKPIDTVGAGDCYNGYLGAMIASGKNILESIITASAAAAISVTRRGAQPSLPVLEEVVKFLEDNDLHIKK